MKTDGLVDGEAKALVIWALSHESFAQTVHINDIRNWTIDLAREKPGLKLTANKQETGEPMERQLSPGRPAYVKIAVDDDIVKALKGPPEKSPYVFLLTAVPTQALETARAEADKPDIWTPGSVQ